MTKEELKFKCLELSFKMISDNTINVKDHKSLRGLAQTLLDFCESSEKYNETSDFDLSPGFINHNKV